MLGPDRHHPSCEASPRELLLTVEQINQFTLWSRNLLGNDQIQFKERLERLTSLINAARRLNETLASSSLQVGAKSPLQDALRRFNDEGAKGLDVLISVRDGIPSSLRSLDGTSLTCFISADPKPRVGESHVPPTDQLSSIRVFFEDLLTKTTLLCGAEALTEARLLVQDAVLRRTSGQKIGNGRVRQRQLFESIRSPAKDGIDLMGNIIWNYCMSPLESCVTTGGKFLDAIEAPRPIFPDRPGLVGHRDPPVRFSQGKRHNGLPIP